MSKAPSTKATIKPASKVQHTAPAQSKAPLRSGMLANTRLNDTARKSKGPPARR